MYYVNILQGTNSDWKQLKICSFNNIGIMRSDNYMELSDTLLKTWFELLRIDWRSFLKNFEDGNNNFQFTCKTEEYDSLCLLYKLEQI